MQILGVRIDELTKQQALEKARGFLLTGGPHKIFTPNPEMLVDAQKDANFKTALNGGDMNLCDGFGLWLVASVIARKRRGGADVAIQSSPLDPHLREGDTNVILAKAGIQPSVTRITGIDFMLDLCALAEKEGKSIYLLGSGSEDVVKKTAQVLQDKYPILKIVGTNSGIKIKDSRLKIIYDNNANEALLYDIIVKAPDIIFVAFGHGKQEKWIAQNLRDLPSVKIAMGVGGAFDFISGKVKRAPKFMRKIGLEWLWRLVREPRRIGRIWKAVVVFIFYLIKKR